ncbi:GNAT family N-acetyltransferase [Allorhizobium taibaishanense]|uniref:RimJ/RimL family protein N-acetyltransferase n=1 Tax=Allorhizobium taibaishanense TaxID=887144 RepID=A0A1Q8ZZE2_9HYPH|nr:GNAT family protein [Allorhizobium taibaishanense]MBB4007512.1 RimJ/RimL family protein N-acetyltransferase [Allorhizobium taibaishanense]OLP47540.1 hypothetical protein BJF91_03810 [Allorhizobium taibaishanense]
MVGLRPATEADIPAMMEAERQPGYDALVGRFTTQEHVANLADPTAAYQVAVGREGQVLGFVFFRDLTDPHANLYIKRVVVAEANKGTGTAMLRLALAWAFTETSAYRIWLTHVPENLRAHALYSKLGFREEGLLRQAYGRADGTRGDLVQMSLLKPEWTAAASIR